MLALNHYLTPIHIHLHPNLQVNCWMVTSLEQDIKIKYPVAYYHCATLDSADIRRQWFEVSAGLDSVGIRVVANVCDCAGEHVRFFQNVLKQHAVEDDTCLIRRDHTWVIPDAPHVNKNCRNNMKSSGSGRGHTRWLRRNGNYIGWSVVNGTYTVSTTLPNGAPRPLAALTKFPYDAVHPCGILRLRVPLSVAIFRYETRIFIEKNIERIADEAKVRVQDVRETLLYMEKVDELFTIMNGKHPITWSDKGDGSGTPIGLRDECNTNVGLTLRGFAKKYGVSLQYLKRVSGLPNADSRPKPGSLLLVDRLERLVSIGNWFRDWKHSVQSTPSISKATKAAMFITPTTYDAILKTCFGTVGLIKMYVTNSTRCWVLRRLNQDPLESTFGQLRAGSGSNVDMTVKEINSGMSRIRALGLKNTKRKNCDLSTS